MDQNLDTVVTGPDAPRRTSTIVWIIVITIVLMMCCCCALFFGALWYLWTYGDAIFGLTSAMSMTLV